MQIIAHLNDPRNEPDPNEEIKKRIRAKIEFWTFLQESVVELLAAYENSAELSAEIINTVIYFLHPVYDGTELIEEARIILIALKIPVPESYGSDFADAFQRIVVKKMLQTIVHRRGEKE